MVVPGTSLTSHPPTTHAQRPALGKGSPGAAGDGHVRLVPASHASPPRLPWQGCAKPPVKHILHFWEILKAESRGVSFSDKHMQQTML